MWGGTKILKSRKKYNKKIETEITAKSEIE